MADRPSSVKQYLAALPADRRAAMEAVRATIKANLDPKFEEGIQYGMVGYYLPHSVFPAGYHCDPTQPLPFASIASQKNHLAIYLFCIYTAPGEAERFAKEWKATGKRLDMGKSCVRFKKLEDVPLEVLGRAIKRATAAKFLKSYLAGLAGTPAGRSRSTGKATTKVRGKATEEAATKAVSSSVGKATKKSAKKTTKKAAKKATKKVATTAASKTTKKASTRATKKSTK
ncbi:DUF1801 domain-containing protein [Engelhardtia mirabilis]|uniref:YdhG-like domain-containing protein n=1 Tax=Engelhardtia mirabilis TaxID=2528011 RepID=A0A518BMY2_9BACT|nr:hypothetical protein Pla133_34300 [Planctomycetes bacterium Pla133]QDV02660.1 hypothetical protein Pla86_34290 [Planctomycetes bacterium Pla86]